MKVVNKTNGILVSSAAARADTFMTRLFGLIPKKSIGPEEALWLEPCTMIHMCFMSFPIDAVFLDRNMRVVRVLENFRPWRFSPYVGSAAGVLERPAGRCRCRVSTGDTLEFVL